ncbi:hypothetical protein SLS62_004024 [Diatrype stigma]|uniref:Protein kinase domain-containing protein n=1 Tax=Diatrype stigma TaxID=117547 RepID=A0AAN9UTZ3_9PEZI
MDDYLSVFYILIELNCTRYIGLFRDKGLDDHHLPITLGDLKSKIEIQTSDGNGFHERFFNEQYRWCPMVFDLNMSSNGSRDNPVIPLCRKERIEPRRDGYKALNHISTLWKVEVPEELITERLRDKIEHAKLPQTLEGTEDTQIYPASKHAHFVKERVMAEALKDEDGMVRYFGWFRSYEVQDDQSIECYNLVLELGEMDLSEAFQKYLPPMSPDGILAFWERMGGLALALNAIHTLSKAKLRYNMCHGDIKPENILCVNGRFKIADPAEAAIEISASPNVPETCSPEKSRYMTGDAVPISRIPLSSDVWSLGCVYSVAATYMVLGSQGVIKYNRVRIQANLRRNGRLDDRFHDGSEVLPEVKLWHDYLRRLARKSDNLTYHVLDLIDDKMLVGQVEDRAEARDICKLMLDKINEHNGANWSNMTSEFQDFLNEVEDLGEAEGYDEDGMELYFTNPDTPTSVQQDPEQGVEDFVKAMRNGKPQEDTPRHESGIIPALMRILTSYSEAIEKKPKTILILTDGIWAGILDGDVDTFIKSQIKVLRLGSSAHSRPVTFQFIRFGHDPTGMERLRRLDDDMKERGLPDLIDAEPADGDVYKMFLGSIVADIDDSANVMNSVGLSPMSPSGRSSLSFPQCPEI